MIRRVVDFALGNVCCAALALILFAEASFVQAPADRGLPDVADNYVEIITQCGNSAEQIEQQVTIPLEVVMNGIPHVVHLRSFSLFGSRPEADLRRRIG